MKKIVSIMLVFVIGIIAGYFIFPKSSNSLPWSIEKQKSYINILLDKGLNLQAIEEYKKLVLLPGISKHERANLNYLVGNLYMENLHDYESALTHYLRIKILVPESKLMDEVNQKIVECLERSGRSFDAQKEIDQTTMLNQPASKSKSPLIARIGKREIRQQDLDAQIRMLPLQLQAQYKDKAKQKELLQQYIATELLVDSARRKGYDKDDKFLVQLGLIRKNILAQRVLEDELKGKIKPTEREIKLYYEAHKTEFKDKDKQNSLDKSKPQIESILQQEKIQEEQQTLFNKLIQTEKVEIYDAELR